MSNGQEVKIENPECEANFLSRLFFIWTIPFYKKILDRTISISTIPVMACDDAEVFGQKLEYYWEKELHLAEEQKRKPELWKALMKIFRKKKLVFDFIELFNYVILRPSLGILLSIVTRTFRTDYHIEERCLFGAALVIVAVISFMIEHSVNYQLSKMGMRMATAVSSLIYRKTVNLNLKAIQKISSENLTRVLSDDLQNIQEVAIIGSKAFICPIQFVVIILAMWATIGFTSLTGALFILIFIIPIHISMEQLTKFYNMKLTESTRTRVTLLTETVKEIRLIKMSAWEKSFEKIIASARISELKNIFNYFNCQLIYYNIFIHKFSTYLSVTVLFLYTKVLQPEQVFSCSYFLILILLIAVYWLPKSIKAHIDSRETMNSITELILMQEFKIFDSLPNEKPEINVNRLCANWLPISSYDIRIESIKIKPGSLCIITGPSGAGKTTLLQLLLRELLPNCGTVEIRGYVSFCSQKSWLYPTTIRDNILFGRPYRESRYRNVTSSCSLQSDFVTLTNGDNSIVGSEVGLTSDQRARINLARAVYRDANIYLFDDVLSKLDMDIGRRVFDDCFIRYLATKTRLIVTNQLQYFDRADQIIVVNKGKAQVFDNLTHIKDGKIDLFNWIQDISGLRKFKTQVSHIEPEKYEPTKKDEVFEDPKKNYEALENGLYQYFKSGQYFAATCIFLVVTHVVITFCDFWMARWSNILDLTVSHSHDVLPLISVHSPFKKTNCTLLDSHIVQKTETELIVYSIMILAGFLLTILSNRLLIFFFNTSSKTLQENLIFSILRAPLRYFDGSASGKILNSMTFDVTVVDKNLPHAVKQSIQICLFSIGCLFLILVSDWILICSIFIAFLYLKIQKWYIVIDKKFKLLEETARNPIYSHLRSTILGITTIRVNEAQRNCTEQFNKLLDNHTTIFRLNLACRFSFAIWSDLLCNMFLILVVFGSILLNEYVQTIKPAYVGLAVFQVLQLITILQFGSREIINLVQDVDSVNRIIDLSKVPGEQLHEKTFNDSLQSSSKSKLSLISLADCKLAPDTWPEDGEIQFRNVSLTYNGKNQALQDVNFTIKGREKIGLVGKSKSGKSSLVAALLNINDFEGNIIIDKIDTELVILECLRNSFSILQEPVLFSDTIGYNLDPAGEFADEELWAALEEVEMKEYVNSLSQVVTSNNTHFSKGQIQLLCLARIILRKNKIVILDEATTNLDKHTQKLIHKIVKNKFSHCTVITIENCLTQTIMESDRVLVMESGKVVEFDHPFSLLESQGAFYKLVCEAGKSVYSHYRHLAYQHYAQKFKTSGNK